LFKEDLCIEWDSSSLTRMHVRENHPRYESGYIHMLVVNVLPLNDDLCGLVRYERNGPGSTPAMY